MIALIIILDSRQGTRSCARCTGARAACSDSTTYAAFSAAEPASTTCTSSSPADCARTRSLSLSRRRRQHRPRTWCSRTRCSWWRARPRWCCSWSRSPTAPRCSRCTRGTSTRAPSTRSSCRCWAARPRPRTAATTSAGLTRELVLLRAGPAGPVPLDTCPSLRACVCAAQRALAARS